MGDIYKQDRSPSFLIAQGNLDVDNLDANDERTALLVTSSRVVAISYKAIETNDPMDAAGLHFQYFKTIDG